MPDGSATAHLYRPKLATLFSEGYGWDKFRKDILAGLTVAVVALPLSMAIAVRGGVESLLSAKVADSMTGRRHRSNIELVAQGIANIASALFGGISVTGTIARTATNIRAGATSPIAGIMHALFVLLFLLIAAPFARFIPLAALAGVLVVVCWNMAEKKGIRPVDGRLAHRRGAVDDVSSHLGQGFDLRHCRRMPARRSVQPGKKAGSGRGRIGSLALSSGV